MSDRRALYGALIFVGLMLVCFVFALILLRSGGAGGDDEGDGPRIGVVEVSGPIVGARETLGRLRRLRRDPTIAAIVVRINSPGGAVAPSQEIHREIVRTRAKKPVVASLATIAASGGYYIASACQQIVASPGTLTGSIGVIAQTTELVELLRLARIRTHTMKSGKFKDAGSPLREMTAEDRAQLQGTVDAIHRQFVRDVAAARKLKVAEVQKVADGRVLVGEQAKQHKLVDRLGNLTDALEVAAKLASAEGEPVPVFERDRRGLLWRLLEQGASSAARGLREGLRSETTVEARHPSLR